mgnify:FL=1
MDSENKADDAYRTIGEVAQKLNLVNKKTGHLQTHTIRYWETQFKQIKPSIRAGKRRYYSAKDVKIIKNIQFLLKVKGLTINGVKKVLNKDNAELLDRDINIGVYNSQFGDASIIKNKIKNISKIIKELKKYK